MNSGMTCYMNSLLQSLFMTPEFRNALFQWKFEGPPEEAETSIPYQLQRLFVQLCVTSHTAVNTLGLTTSFGWQATEVFQQQDIHELCRVMFDALEKKMGLNTTASPVPRRDSQGDYVVVDHVDNTQRHFINRLYQGQRSDRVRCCVCQSMSNKRATFLDIQVPLRPFGLDVSSYSSLDEAFRAMLKPERLDGSNQYYCSHCGKKQDAMLDCVYERMPYLLSLQLMRFTFDPRTGDRIKLNDRVSFPLEDWDISEFVVLPTDSPSHLEDHDASRTDCGAEGDHELFDDDEAVVCNLNEDGRVYCRPGLNGILSASNTTEPVEDEDVDLGTDSGANSGLDSPFGASSSLSPPHPMDGSASDSQHEVMDQEDGVPDQQPTLTVDQASQLRLSSFTRSMTDPLDTDDDDNDDGFGTGDTQSACSSLHDQNHDQQQFVDGPIHSTQPATLLGTATKTTGVVSGIMLDRTPTKTTMDEIQPATNVAHPASKPTSKLVYKLFSIVVHSGSISGGHYFAFIRSFADNQWYQFNDRHVTRANYADLLNTFGAKQPSYLSRASAYYLMYRRVDPLNNEHFLHEDEFPPHIAQMAKQIREQEAEEEAKRLRAMSLCKVSTSTPFS
ncbi:Ubiquitin carboxyl-terminal hydrolase 47 [Fasciola hepatica]|uniref:Ubiquitin carboxyl-terminal hydrolase 47 n=1 Tax=Fasciola hepatica TaxID=6192 RepID=A0A4E0QU18_FASHE|nr:Ubiquitin carboxyl-terminal hydrolase 47 [Fasciola hepatica]